jgi:hypothetical protein
MAITQIIAIVPGIQLTPYSTYFLVVGDDAADPGTLPRADVLNGCSPGPLKEVLTRTADWTVFNLNGSKCGAINCRVYQYDRRTENTRFLFEANGLKASVGNSLSESLTIILELRLSQTERY